MKIEQKPKNQKPNKGTRPPLFKKTRNFGIPNAPVIQISSKSLPFLVIQEQPNQSLPDAPKACISLEEAVVYK